MKTIILALSIALACTFNTFAQSIPDSTLINFTSKDGDLQISFGGQELIFGQIPDEIKEKAKFNLDFCRSYSLGWNFIPGSDHSNMTVGQDYLNIRPLYSTHFEMDMVSFAVKFPSRNSISLGISLSADNYRFNDNITIQNVDNKIVAIPLSDIEKSKFKGVYVGFPIAFDMYLGRGFYLTPVAEFSLLAKANTEVKSPKEKVNLTGLNDCQMNYGLRFTKHGNGFFINYSPTPIFMDGFGAKANRLTFGVVFFC